MLNSVAASVSRQDFHAETETTILQGKKDVRVDMIAVSQFQALMVKTVLK